MAMVLYGTNGHEKGKILVPDVELRRRQFVVRQTEQEGDADENVPLRGDTTVLVIWPTLIAASCTSYSKARLAERVCLENRQMSATVPRRDRSRTMANDKTLCSDVRLRSKLPPALT